MKPSIPLLLLLAAAAPSARLAAGEIPSTITPVGPEASLAGSVGLQPAAEPGAFLGGGPDYRVQFDAQGMSFQPALGRSVEQTQSLGLGLASIARGDALLLDSPEAVAPRAGERVVVYDRAGGIEERYELSPAGVELSFVFPEPLPGEGDLVVRMALATGLPLPSEGAADGGLRFELAGAGGVSIGSVLGIDADGREAAGTLRLAAGALELVLPADFVASASYPLVLDPKVGAILTVVSGGNDDSNPDAAYDASTDRYLVVWQREFSATDIDIRGQRVDSAGALVGGTIFFGSQGVAENPSVADSNTYGQFAVTWQQREPGTLTLYTIQIQTVLASTGALVNQLTVAGTFSAALITPDIGGDGVKNIGFESRMIVVWEDQASDEIRGRSLYHDTFGHLHAGVSFTIAADNPTFFIFNSKPVIARSAGVYHRLLVVYQRDSGILLGSNPSIRGQVLDLFGALYGSSVSIASSATHSLVNPDVDGFDRRFVIAWEAVPESGPTNIQICSADLNVSTGALIVKPPVNVTSIALFGNATRPAVGFSMGKSWIAWRETSTLLITSNLRIRGYDSGSCISCEGPLTLEAGTFAANEWVAVATPTSGGAYYDDRGLAVWSKTVSATGDIKGQALANSSLGGSIADLGGGCGPGGIMTYSAGPAIGTSWFIFGIIDLPPGAPVSILNISSPAVAPLTCGACAWNPFQLTVIATVQGTQASGVATIPCNPALIGSQHDAQWTTFAPGQSACALFPDFVTSNRARLTIGQ